MRHLWGAFRARAAPAFTYLTATRLGRGGRSGAEVAVLDGSGLRCRIGWQYRLEKDALGPWEHSCRIDWGSAAHAAADTLHLLPLLLLLLLRPEVNFISAIPDGGRKFSKFINSPSLGHT